MTPLVPPASAEAPAYAELIRLHRHSLIHLLLVGGTARERTWLALAFHRESPLRRGPFVRLRGRRDEDRLRCALECALSAVECGRPDSPLLESEGGTLFVDHVERLSLATQRVLLSFLGTLSPSPGAPAEAWFGRLAVGSAEPLEATAAAGRFLPALHDILDKIHVDLRPWPHRRIQ
jgi:DNA-binding NtrC family response regulator